MRCVLHPRDESACVTLQRVPKPGGKEGELQDKWIEYRHPSNELDLQSDRDFPERNEQVS